MDAVLIRNRRIRSGSMASSRFDEIDRWLTGQAKKENRSEGEKKRQIYLLGTHFSRARFQENYECLFPGCRHNAIRSHIFQRGNKTIGAVMNTVSCDGLTMIRHFDQTKGHVCLKEISNGAPATFAGFCEEHDRLFHEFEDHGTLSDEKHFILQAYRCACRELSIRDNASLAMKNAVSEIREDIIRKLKLDFTDTFAPTLDELSWFEQRANNMKFWIDSDSARLRLETFGESPRISNKISIICEKLRQYADSDVKKPPKNLFVSRKIINKQLPIAVSGIFIWGPNHKGDFKILLVVAIPNNGKQEMIFVCTSGDVSQANTVIGDLASDAQCIEFIEKFTISKADCWYLNPKYFKSMPLEQQETLRAAVSKAGDGGLNDAQCVFGFNCA